MSKPIRLHSGEEAALYDHQGNKAIALGVTVPTDTVAGYGTGCLFVHTDGGVGTSIYVNEGTSSSADFNAIQPGAAGGSFSSDVELTDTTDLSLGTGNDALLRWSTGDASDHSVVLALGDTSQMLHITDKAAVATDWAITSPTHPTVYVHSNTTPITDYVSIGNHDGTTAIIDVVGGTTLSLHIASTQAARVIAGGIQLGTAGTTLGLLKLDGNTSGTVTVNTAAAAGTWTLTLPADNGDAGEQLQTDGNGVTTWEAAGSMRAVKSIISDLSDRASDALGRIVSRPVYAFHYKENARQETGLPALSDTQTEFHGIMAEDYPEVMMWGGKIFCPISAFGEACLAIKALTARIEELELAAG